ncbi:hypothetical protein Q9R19_01630 [Microbacterium sp. ARD32]|uniref:hypothetical protein n=1 Tax=Microbacterium sp. ARD32 TaxID=2962577 RepID=UPI0028818AE7|nr:hypothetical protein [Microbacterium sp. ARD32]MDT0156317.1 hypothetical protein [Microbacterium sp. ARD32]
MSDSTPQASGQQLTSKLMRGAIWIAIGALIAAALVCVVWVLIGNQDGLIGRAFLTILLLAVFAGIAILEANLAHQRPDWLALSSMISWIVALLVGAVKIWMPEPSPHLGWAMGRFWYLLLVVGILQLALVHARFYLKASQRYVTTFTRVIVMVTFVMLALLVAMLVFYLTFPELFHYDDLYWRIVIALAILAAVGTTLIPLLNALFAPKKTPPVTPPSDFVAPHAPSNGQPQPAAWPTYADGRTPLPVMPDGSPDWNAYYTGFPTFTPPAQSLPAPDAAPQAFPAASDAPAPHVPAAPEAPAAPTDPPASSTPPADPGPPQYGAFPPPPPAPGPGR